MWNVKKSQTLRSRDEKTGRLGLEGRGKEERLVQTFSYKVKKGFNVEHGDYS